MTTEMPNRLQAQEAIENLSLDREILEALSDPAHPGHRVATARRNELYESAYPAGDGSDIADGNEITRSEGISDAADIFWQAPDRAQDYQFDPVPQGLVHDTELDQLARGWFHKAGVPGWLARNLVREWNRSIAAPPDENQIESSAAATEKSLRQQWGDSYEGNISAAKSVIDGLNDESVYDALDRSGMANSEYFIRQLVALAEARKARATR